MEIRRSQVLLSNINIGILKPVVISGGVSLEIKARSWHDMFFKLKFRYAIRELVIIAVLPFELGEGVVTVSLSMAFKSLWILLDSNSLVIDSLS